MTETSYQTTVKVTQCVTSHGDMRSFEVDRIFMRRPPLLPSLFLCLTVLAKPRERSSVSAPPFYVLDTSVNFTQLLLTVAAQRFKEALGFNGGGEASCFSTVSASIMSQRDDVVHHHDVLPDKDSQPPPLEVLNFPWSQKYPKPTVHKEGHQRSNQGTQVYFWLPQVTPCPKTSKLEDQNRRHSDSS
jgi:hypothetical protein